MGVLGHWRTATGDSGVKAALPVLAAVVVMGICLFGLVIAVAGDATLFPQINA